MPEQERNLKRSPLIGKHLCHASDCVIEVPPVKFVCRKHWAKLPKVFQDAIYREYVKGQEVSKTPTTRYIAVQRGAIAVIAKLEGNLESYEHHRAFCDIWRTYARQGPDGKPQGGDPFTEEMELVLYGKLTGMIPKAQQELFHVR